MAVALCSGADTTGPAEWSSCRTRSFSFVTGKASLLFLRKFNANDIFEVSARAQGQYPLTIDEKTKVRKLIRSANVGVLFPPKDKAVQSVPQVSTQVSTQSTNHGANGTVEMSPQLRRLAQDVIHDKPLDEVTREIATTWKRGRSPSTTAGLARSAGSRTRRPRR